MSGFEGFSLLFDFHPFDFQSSRERAQGKGIKSRNTLQQFPFNFPFIKRQGKKSFLIKSAFNVKQLPKDFLGAEQKRE